MMNVYYNLKVAVDVLTKRSECDHLIHGFDVAHDDNDI